MIWSRISLAISKTLLITIIIIAVVGIALATYFSSLKGPIQTTITPFTTITTPVYTTPMITITPSLTTPVATVTTPITTTPMTTPSPTTPQISLYKLVIGTTEIRVPKELYDFAMKAKAGSISVTINFWTSMYPFEADIIKEAVNMFMKEYPGVKVNYQNVQNMKEMVKAGVLAGDVENTAHVFTWAHDWTGEFADAGYIIALDNYLPPETLNDLQSQYAPIAFSAAQLRLHLYGLPWAAEAIALICDASKVPQIPSKFSDLENNVFKKYTDASKGLYGLSYQIDPYHIYPFVTAFGGYYYDETTDTSAFNSTGTYEGIKFLLEHVFPYLYTSDLGGETQLKLFTDGKTPCIITGPWNGPRIREVYGDKIVIAPIPDIDGKTPKPFVGVKLLWITSLVKNDPNRLYASILFSLWFTLNDGSLKMFVDKFGYIPVKNSLIEYVSAHKEQYKYVYGFLESVLRGVPMPKVPKMGCVWDPVGTAVNAIVTEYNEKGLKTTLDDLRNILNSAATTLVEKCKVKLVS
jgi:arabinogalactan oligomer/maltooligosaccharide transport system substrate-binding protein